MWLSMLVRGVHLLVKRRGSSSDSAMFVLGDLYNSVVLGWPAVPLPDEPLLYKFKTPLCVQELAFLVVDDLDAWDGALVRWYSPANLRINEVQHSGVAGFATQWTSLLGASALGAFGKLSLAQLGALANAEHLR